MQIVVEGEVEGLKDERHHAEIAVMADSHENCDTLVLHLTGMYKNSAKESQGFPQTHVKISNSRLLATSAKLLIP
jgi:hypothetical protein